MLPGSGFRFVGEMCLAVNGAASNKIIALALLMDVLLDDKDADLLNGIDGMIVQARLRRVAWNQTMHWKQIKGCHPERARVAPGKERRNHESFLHLAGRWRLLYCTRRRINRT